MPGNPREMITMAERQFPVRIRIAVPQGGLGQRYGYITAVARSELRLRWLGDHTFGIARSPE